ncbi:Putative Catalytic activity: NADH acceptor <=_ NAD() reduced acceptor [Penicillium brasilianum]|uniref:Putative Catalytic activity: NADH acceptor <=> NAD( ) reduced acceptor n=1 Tax=Penicillium brasilianum TaxID=104259 RepID=A0A0F7VJW4_PENBI|nr:Putative Catalytic activity: NADH acceptor <=> NAD() reduced acceptor [Penicillium brasilianum]
MAEGLAEKKHLPGTRILSVYGKWAKGGWGALLTGNIQVDVRHLGGHGDLATCEDQEYEQDSLNAWRRYANNCQQNGTPAIAQICHPGRQSPRGAGERGFFEKTIAPSEIALDIGNGLSATIVRNLVFGVPQAMTHFDIDRIIAQFVTCARILAQCGFSGIEIHAAHGYLLSQFLSKRSNSREDQYGGSAERRARIILEIIHQIRKAVPKTFCIGIKLNSADHTRSDFEDTMAQIRLISEANVDFLEISGGTYENPTMMGRGLNDETSDANSSTTLSREAFFLDFATETRNRFPELILMVTGGFRTRKGIEAALKAGVCDLVGIGRPAVLNADFPRLMMDDDVYSDKQAQASFSKVPLPLVARLLKIRMLGGGAETQYFRAQIHRIATGNAPRPP